MPHNVGPATAGRALLGQEFVFVFSSFPFLSPALNHLPRLASAAGLLADEPFFIFLFLAELL